MNYSFNNDLFDKAFQPIKEKKPLNAIIATGMVQCSLLDACFITLGTNEGLFSEGTFSLLHPHLQPYVALVEQQC